MRVKEMFCAALLTLAALLSGAEAQNQWKCERSDRATVTFREGGRRIELQADNPPQSASVRLFLHTALKANEQYLLSFDADVDEILTGRALYEKNSEPWTDYGLKREFKADRGRSRVKLLFTARERSGASARLILDLQFSGKVTLSDLRCEPKTYGPGDEFREVVTVLENTGETAQLSAAVDVRESQRVKPFEPELFGMGFCWDYIQRIMGRGDLEDAAEKFGPFPWPLIRVAGCDSQWFHWQDAIGPVDQRRPTRLGWSDAVCKIGPLEWITQARNIHPGAKVIYALNITEPPKMAGELVEFLSGVPGENRNGGTDYAVLRAEMGHPEPIRGIIWSIGNEADLCLQKEEKPLDAYLEVCRKFIPQLLKSDPDAVIAVNVATFPSNNPIHTKHGSWREWHRALLREFGDKIAFLDYHGYYYGISLGTIEKELDAIRDDVREVTGSNRIRTIITEHGVWPDNTVDSSKWGRNHYQIWSLRGILGAGAFCTRMLNRPDVAYSAYFWELLHRHRSGILTERSLMKYYRMLSEIQPGEVVATETRGMYADPTKNDMNFCAATVKEDSGTLVLLINNRDTVNARPTRFTFENGSYALEKCITLTGPSYYSYDSFGTDNIRLTETHPADSGAQFETMTIPPKSTLLLRLRRIQ